MPINPRSWDIPVSLNKLQEEMNNMFDRLYHKGITTGPFDGQQWAPAVDLYECPNDFTLFVELVGVEPERIELQITGNKLTIRGTKEPSGEEHPGQESVSRERRFGRFCRTIELPAEVNAEGVEAKCHNGVLRVHVPKTEASTAKAIRVNVVE
jgi:HSP20 family protein